MEYVRARDHDSSTPPIELSTTSPTQADRLLLTPNRREFDAEHPAWPSSTSMTNSQHSDKRWFSTLPSLQPKFEPQRQKPLFRGFERPSFSRIAILTVLCLVTYPAFHILTLVAKDRSLFIVRIIVSVWCSGGGFALGYVLLKIGAQHIEAASEFTFVGSQDSLRFHFEQRGPPRSI